MKKERGYTLVELIFVIFIIGILASIAVPNFLTARDKARIAAGKGNLNIIIKGINMYFAEYGNYPVQASMDNATTIPVLQEELNNPDSYLRNFYDSKIQQYKVPPLTAGESSPYEILVRTNAEPNREGKVCWLYYSESKDLLEVWVAP
ncbi:MAG: prepilin-type N-terminal cleavage/methylation domain-containing protein [bacterium]|nr:prepilin-type N-terminal cleavage/methylation domain-containing protein [bacterium]